MELRHGYLLDGTSRLHKGDTEIKHLAGVSSFAEYVVVPESGIVKIRPDVPLEAAALVGCGVMTGVGAVIDTAKVEPGSSVAVIGCGGEPRSNPSSRNAMSINPSLAYVFYTVWIILAAVGLYLAIQVYRKKISWGQARRMGIPISAFAWMNIIYGLVLFEGAYGFVSVLLDLPLWMDITLFLGIFGMTVGVYFKLRRRAKFNSAVFMALFLIPLSIPGIHTAVKLVPEMGKVMPAVGKLVLLIPGVQTAKKLIPLNASEIRKLDKIPKPFPQWPQIGDSGYRVEFKGTLSKGTFGDWLTARRMGVKRYTKLPSKIDKSHGLDGVYARYSNGNLQEVLIVENKVDGGKLKPRQMTDEWITKQVDKMIDHADEKVRRTGELIRSSPDLVRKELWHHDLDDGVTTISSLDAKAGKISNRVEKFISNQVRKRCESAMKDLICLPVN